MNINLNANLIIVYNTLLVFEASDATCEHTGGLCVIEYRFIIIA
jgi:hypothetical protein